MCKFWKRFGKFTRGCNRFWCPLFRSQSLITQIDFGIHSFFVFCSSHVKWVKCIAHFSHSFEQIYLVILCVAFICFSFLARINSNAVNSQIANRKQKKHNNNNNGFNDSLCFAEVTTTTKTTTDSISQLGRSRDICFSAKCLWGLFDFFYAVSHSLFTLFCICIY